jgi:hypothetical protein
MAAAVTFGVKTPPSSSAAMIPSYLIIEISSTECCKNQKCRHTNQERAVGGDTKDT